MKKTITIQTKAKNEELSIDAYARWLCLMEAIHIVCKKADELGMHTDKDMSWVKPISFQKYIDERFVSMKHETELDLGIFKGGLERNKNNLVSQVQTI
jgi:hypothetical protein